MDQLKKGSVRNINAQPERVRPEAHRNVSTTTETQGYEETEQRDNTFQPDGPCTTGTRKQATDLRHAEGLGAAPYLAQAMEKRDDEEIDASMKHHLLAMAKDGGWMTQRATPTVSFCFV